MNKEGIVSYRLSDGSRWTLIKGKWVIELNKPKLPEELKEKIREDQRRGNIIKDIRV